MAKIEKHPGGNSIIFDPRWHKYTCVEQPRIKFVSGTKFLGEFFKPFDKENVSKKYATKHGMTQKEVLDLWDAKAVLGRETGNLIHNYLEKKALGKEISHEEATRHPDKNIQEAALRKIKNADSAFDSVSMDYDIIHPEMIVASLTHNIAGMIDILAKCKKTSKIFFLDWKSNQNIDLSNSWNSGIGPLSHLDDCSYIKYSIQLNLYQRIAMEEKYLVGPDALTENIGRRIIHIKDDGFEFIPCPDLQKEVNDMIMSKAA